MRRGVLGQATPEDLIQIKECLLSTKSEIYNHLQYTASVQCTDEAGIQEHAHYKQPPWAHMGNNNHKTPLTSMIFAHTERATLLSMHCFSHIYLATRNSQSIKTRLTVCHSLQLLFKVRNLLNPIFYSFLKTVWILDLKKQRNVTLARRSLIGLK